MMNENETWRDLIENGSVIMFWKNSLMERNIEQLKQEGFDVYDFDCTNWDEKKIHKDLAETLNFTDYYGENLDAFNDCLSDVETENKGFVLIFRNYDVFSHKHSELAYDLLDIIQTQSWRFLIKGTVLMSFVQSNDINLTFPPIGRMRADWNIEEWSDDSRGL